MTKLHIFSLSHKHSGLVLEQKPVVQTLLRRVKRVPSVGVEGAILRVAKGSTGVDAIQLGVAAKGPE